jgi:hypothetical protein|tara:strand:+ start:1141 stop:1851 length:711 start_codon:yes stop_codon:yes gene_type:complete
MTLLTICQDAANLIGITAPNAVTSSTDTSTIQLEACANQEGRAQVQKYSWEVLIQEGSHTTKAAESQGAMTTIATDFGRFSNQTLWNRTTDRRYYGPITAAKWQQILAVVSGGITNYFRIRGGNLLMHPTPTAGESVKFEYVSKNWVDTSGGTSANADKFSGDSQTTVLEEELVVLGVVWRFLKLKGLPYDQQFVDYQNSMAEYSNHDGASPILRMAGPSRVILALNEPEGNYGGV